MSSFSSTEYTFESKGVVMFVSSTEKIVVTKKDLIQIHEDRVREQRAFDAYERAKIAAYERGDFAAWRHPFASVFSALPPADSSDMIVN